MGLPIADWRSPPSRHCASPVFGDSNVLSALNFSTKVDLFSDISASGRDVEEIRSLHPPHSEGMNCSLVQLDIWS